MAEKLGGILSFLYLQLRRSIFTKNAARESQRQKVCYGQQPIGTNSSYGIWKWTPSISKQKGNSEERKHENEQVSRSNRETLMRIWSLKMAGASEFNTGINTRLTRWGLISTLRKGSGKERKVSIYQILTLTKGKVRPLHEESTIS